MDIQTSSTAYRRSTRICAPIVYAQDVPQFPDGPPTDPAHFDIVRFSTHGGEKPLIGMFDNVVVSLGVSGVVTPESFPKWLLTTMG
jgi:hypothetical protein